MGGKLTMDGGTDGFGHFEGRERIILGNMILYVFELA